MESRKVCHSETAYVLGLVILALGTALMEKAALGMSMVVAPAYLLHLKISRVFPAFSFGMAEYAFQALLLLILTAALRKPKPSYLFSFVTAVVYGAILDLSIRAAGFVPCVGWPARISFYSAGLFLGAVGVALLFHTYIAPEAYELFVKEISRRGGWRIDRVKTAYDCASCLLGVALSFAFFGFGHFEGVKAGTLFCALVNGWLIGRVSRFLDAAFDFPDAFPWRHFFAR